VRITKVQAKRVGNKLGVNWDMIDLEQFRCGIEVESGCSDVVGRNMTSLAMIAIVHLREYPDYYDKRL